MTFVAFFFIPLLSKDLESQGWLRVTGGDFQAALRVLSRCPGAKGGYSHVLTTHFATL